MKFFSRITLLVGILIGMQGQSGIRTKENFIRPEAKTDLQKFEPDSQAAANAGTSEILETLEWNGYAIGFMKGYVLFLASVLGIVFWRSASLQGVFRILEKLKLTLYSQKLITDSTRALTSFFMV